MGGVMVSDTRVLLENATLKLRVRGMKSRPSPEERKPSKTLVGGRIERALWGTHIVALQNVSLHIKEGERVALIGHNGAGKTSLLRLLSGIYTPSEGRCVVHGKRAALLSVALGLSPTMTLRENVRVALALYGIAFSDIEPMIPEILDFAELTEFAHAPLNACSSGMKARLGFGIATSVSPDVFLVDEVFGAGDARFAAKARARLERLFQDARVLVLSSHSHGILKAFCDRALWLEKGGVKAFGPIDDVMKEYQSATSR